MTTPALPERIEAAPLAVLPGPILAIDTSTMLAVAVVAPGAEPVVRSAQAPRRHAESLAPLVQEALGHADIPVADLLAVAVGTGPAAFTGLRVGLMTARTLAFAANLPLWGVPSLDVVAWQGRDDAENAGELLVVRDARRRELFHARYRPDDGVLQRIAGPAVDGAAAPELAGPGAVIGDTQIAVGYGLDPAGRQLRECPEVDPVALALIAVARAAAGMALAAEPLYLRRPDVQAPAARKRATP